MSQNSSGKLFLGQFPRFFFKTVTRQHHNSVDRVNVIYASWQRNKTILFEVVSSDFKMCVDG